MVVVVDDVVVAASVVLVATGLGVVWLALLEHAASAPVSNAMQTATATTSVRRRMTPRVRHYCGRVRYPPRLLCGCALLLLAACASVSSDAAPAAPTTVSAPLTQPPSTTAATTTTMATTTTQLGLATLHALPGHHLGPIPEDETILCPDATDVPIIGDPVAVPGYDDRPTVLQRTADPAAPLVVIFHGQHGCIQNVQSRSDLDQIAVAAGVQVLWLSGQPVPTRSWKVNGRCCEPAVERNTDDLGYTRAAIAAVRALGVTSTTVLSAGVSNGGGMAVTAACKLPELFTGAVVVAGWAPVNCHAADQSLLVFGGSLDENLGSRRAAQTAAMWRTDVVQCPSEPVVEVNGTATITTWSGCTGDTEVRLVQLDGVPHVWPKFDVYDMDDDIILFALGLV